MPFTGPEADGKWLKFLDLYMKLQREVDRHIGHVLRTLDSRPEVAANTVVVFTSDHGEYGASHGLRGKGASATRRASACPLIVKDPRGVLTKATSQARTQLSSSVDVAPLLLTIASGSNNWRSEGHYSHLADRLDLARILADPEAPGRPYVLHATDEIVTEFAVETYAADAPLHVVALRTPEAKYATYSNWPVEGIAPQSQGQENELYDYRTQTGRLELHNSAGESQLEDSLRTQLEKAFNDELRGAAAAAAHRSARSWLRRLLLHCAHRRREGHRTPPAPRGTGRPAHLGPHRRPRNRRLLHPKRSRPRSGGERP